MKIGILTSSRADFGIYYPLVKELWNDSCFEVEIIAFGTHLKKEYGHTIDEIKNLGFNAKHKIDTLTENKEAEDISRSIGDAVIKFSSFWSKNKYDLVFALGDRYEMFAAISSASPFNIDIAHIHAGETTLGAIDNAYRHSISLMSKYLFVSTEEYRKRAVEIIHDPDIVFNVGALSVDNQMNQEFFSLKEFKSKFGIDLSVPSILSTFHPETVSLEKNRIYIKELLSAFEVLKNDYQIIITMPNSDTMGDMIRRELSEFGKQYSNQVKLVESFGMKGYLTVMKHCSMLIGNTSSGFVESAFFSKWVLNLGNRQDGRIITDNILSVAVDKEEILKAVSQVENSSVFSDVNIYGSGNSASKIKEEIKILYGLK
jgi:UDP-hydrolysing UDP-N-acetyl-D-glucosamine 2-epimerase